MPSVQHRYSSVSRTPKVSFTPLTFDQPQKSSHTFTMSSVTTTTATATAADAGAASSSVDRLTTLPDIILLHILSFLPLDDVIRTTRVSKQFHYLWPLSSSLIFTHRGNSRPKDFVSLRKFVSFVDKSLLLLNPISPDHRHVTKFHLDFPYHYSFSPDVTVWLIFAHTHRVKDLVLALSNDENHGDGEQYVLPRRFSENPFLEKLRLAMCSFKNFAKEIKWGALKELEIRSTMLSDAMVKKLVSGCPLLEILELRNCYGFERLSFDHGKLAKLVVDGYWEMDRNYCPALEILAPSVKVLEISGCFSRKRILLGNVFGVVKVKFDFCLTKDELDACVVVQQMLMSMFLSLLHVKDVTFGPWCIEILSTWDTQGLPFRLPDCKHLTLRTPIQQRDLPGILRLLQFSPNVETLVIHVTLPYFEFEVCSNPSISDIYNLGGSYWTSGIFRFSGPYLKHIQIIGFEGRRFGFEIPFLQFLLRNSKDLEKMVIRWNVGCKKLTPDLINEQNQVAQSLLNFPRSSKCALVTFEH